MAKLNDIEIWRQKSINYKGFLVLLSLSFFLVCTRLIPEVINIILNKIISLFLVGATIHLAAGLSSSVKQFLERNVVRWMILFQS